MILSAIFACSRGPSLKAIVGAYVRALNSHQTDSLLVLFDNNSQMELVGMGPALVGKEMLAEKARYDSTLDVKLTLSIARVKQDTVFAVGRESNKWLSLAHLPPSVYSSIIFKIEKGKIISLQAQLSDSSIAAINDVMLRLIPWAEQNEPEKLTRLMPQGAFAYNVNSAEISLELLKEWQGQSVQ